MTVLDAIETVVALCICAAVLGLAIAALRAR